MGAGPARRRASSSYLRERADAHGALLVFDEVITGFRVARGGAQELLGVDADLTVMGKVLGGGLPAAAYGGPRELMERVAPAGDVYQAGTLSGNPLAVAAGLATLRAARRAPPTRGSRELTERLAAGLREAAGDRPVQVVARARACVTVFFSAEPVRDFAGASACDLDAYGALLPGAARARRLPAAVAVRGLVRLARPRRRARSTAPARRPPRRSPLPSPNPGLSVRRRRITGPTTTQRPPRQSLEVSSHC